MNKEPSVPNNQQTHSPLPYGSLHEISQAIGSLQGEFRASQREAADSRQDMRQQLNAIEQSVNALARVTTNFESMRTEYHERFGNIQKSFAEIEIRVRAAEKHINQIEAQHRVNAAWISGVSALIGGVIVSLLDYMLGRH